jgi:hypothetical protein
MAAGNTILTGTLGVGDLQAAKRWIWVVQAAGRPACGSLDRLVGGMGLLGY